MKESALPAQSRSKASAKSAAAAAKTGSTHSQVASPTTSDDNRLDPAALSKLVAAQLDDDKAENILEISLVGKSPLCDAMIVASGRSQRHVSSLADHVARTLKDAGVEGVRVEGLPNADWVLIDGGDVIVHIFRPEVREFYNLERLWSSDAAPTKRAAGV